MCDLIPVCANIYWERVDVERNYSCLDPKGECNFYDGEGNVLQGAWWQHQQQQSAKKKTGGEGDEGVDTTIVTVTRTSTLAAVSASASVAV